MGSDSPQLSIFLMVLKYFGPSIALYTAGAVSASLLLTRYPRPARLALAGCSLLILSNGTQILSYFQWMIPQWIKFRFSLDPQTVTTAIIIQTMILHALGFSLIFMAAFVDRRSQTEPVIAAQG